MPGWSESLLTYGLTIVISFAVAGMIQLMVVLLEKRSKNKHQVPAISALAGVVDNPALIFVGYSD